MKYLRNVLCALNLYCFVTILNGEPFNGTAWSTSESSPICDDIGKQLDTWRLGNDVLKLRLDIIELNMEKQQHHFIQIESKLQGIEDYLQKIDRKLDAVLNDEHESTNQNAMHEKHATADIKKKNDVSGDNISAKEESIECSKKSQHSCGSAQGIPDEESLSAVKGLNITDNILQAIQSKLTEIGSKAKPQQDLIEVGQYLMVRENENEVPKICLINGDHNILCSTITLPTSCAKSNYINCFNNQCRIQNRLYGPDSFLVPCEDTIDGGGWTVVQRRINDSTDFYRDWSEYKRGFGDLNGNYWMGLDKLHALTTTLAPVELRIELKDFDNVSKYATYDSFDIGDESTKYFLETLGDYSGTAGDSLSYHRGHKFSTKDQDNDDFDIMHCAQYKHGGWWYNQCLTSNLNGLYYNTPVVPNDKRGICWGDFRGFSYSLKFVQIMIRPKRL